MGDALDEVGPVQDTVLDELLHKCLHHQLISMNALDLLAFMTIDQGAKTILDVCIDIVTPLSQDVLADVSLL